MGRPILGEHTRLEVIIEESYEFKVRSPPLPTREARPTSAPRRFIVSVYAVQEADIISGTGSLMERPVEQKWESRVGREPRDPVN